MSILNVWITPARALVAVDTAVDAMNPADHKTARIEGGKLFLFPHCQMVMGFRGQGVFAADVFRAVHLCAQESVSLDVVERAFPGDLNGLYGVHVALMKHNHGMDVAADFETELAFVGYSERRGRMAGIAYTIRPGEHEFTAQEIDPWHIGPDPGMDNPPVGMLDDPTMMELVARQQVKHARQLLGDPAIGGRLLLAELTPDSFSMRQIATLTAVGPQVTTH